MCGNNKWELSLVKLRQGPSNYILVYGKHYTDAAGSVLIVEAWTKNNIWEEKKDLKNRDQILYTTNAKQRPSVFYNK